MSNQLCCRSLAAIAPSKCLRYSHHPRGIRWGTAQERADHRQSPGRGPFATRVDLSNSVSVQRDTLDKSSYIHLRFRGDVWLREGSALSQGRIPRCREDPPLVNFGCRIVKF
jgi:hypothetical protein